MGVEPTRDVYSPILDLKTQGVISYQIEIELFTETYPLIYGQIMTEVENQADRIYNTKKSKVGRTIVQKDWKNAACTRYRPFFTLCLCVFLIVTTWAVMAFVGQVTIKRKIREYDQRIEKLTVGMEEKDLIRIMGNPVSKETIKSADWQSIPAEIKRQHEYLVSYGYWLLSFYSTSELRSHTVFLDESDKRIVYIMPTFGFSVLMGFRADDLFRLILVIEAVLIWLGVKWWCRRKRKLST